VRRTAHDARVYFGLGDSDDSRDEEPEPAALTILRLAPPIVVASLTVELLGLEQLSVSGWLVWLALVVALGVVWALLLERFRDTRARRS
jgi:O-antigen/teichoic acid export membrane protein